MSDAITLIKNPQLAESQDYALLREVGLSYVSKLSNSYWTDFNAHDPGVTILELLAYAITDLGYRTSFEVKDLLTEEVQGSFQNTGTFHTARHIFTANPTSFNDLRKWLVDIDGVRNVWVSKNRSIQYGLDKTLGILVDVSQEDLPTFSNVIQLNGLFDILLEYEDYVEEEDRIARLGILEEEEGALEAANFISPGGEGVLVKTWYDCSLRTVHVYHNNVGVDIDENLQINLLRVVELGPPELVSTRQFTLTSETVGEKRPLVVDFELEAGQTYLLQADATTVELYRNPTGNFPYHLNRVAEVRAGFDGTSVDTWFYFYDWEFTYVISPVELEYLEEAEPMKGNVGLPNGGSSGFGYINAGMQKLLFNVHCPLILESVGIYPENAGGVSVRLLDATGEVLQVVETFAPLAGAENRISLHWAIEAGREYQIDAAGSTIRLGRNNNASYPMELFPAMEITSGLTGSGTMSANQYYFFYHWEVSYQPCLPQVSSLTRQDIREAVKDRIHTVRNLCEDLIQVRELKTEEIGVCAEINAHPEADLEALLAEVFYQMELHISPSVNFYTIEELQAKGKTIDEIFEGPLLDHGFIDDDEFRAISRRNCIRSSDIYQILMDIDGIETVRELSLLSYLLITDENPALAGEQVVTIGEDNYVVVQEEWLLALQEKEFFAPDFLPERSKFIFYKNGLPYLPNLRRANELYQEKRTQNIRNRLKGHDKDLPVPTGTYKSLGSYYPVQNDLPSTYKVGQGTVRRSASSLRKAQSKQLKAFLLFFEQILANYLSQLDHFKELFSWEQTEVNSYFTQPLSNISGLEELYIDYLNLSSNLEEIIETGEVAQERKNRFLDHLLGRFSEDLAEYSLMMYSLYQEDSLPIVISDKQCLLKHYPESSSQRGKAFDYRKPFELTGFQKRIYRLLGIGGEDSEIAWRRFASESIRIVNIGTTLEPQFQIELLNDEDQVIFQTEQDEDCNSRTQMCSFLDNLIPFAANGENWEWVAAASRWELIQDCEGERRLLGFTSSLITTKEEFQEEILAYFTDYAHREGFHLIEHILLRKRSQENGFLPIDIHRKEGECDCVEVEDPYSFRMSIILPSWPERFQSTRFRQFVEKKIRLEVPAHIYVKICWISHCEMQVFENCYTDWLQRHADLPEEINGTLPLTSTLVEDDVELSQQLNQYSNSLNELIIKLHDLTTVFPLAQIHDCENEGGDEPPITLNNTTLGSL